MKKKHVCMIAYTGYARDTRVRREAETLALNGYKVSFLVPRSGTAEKAKTYEQDGVSVIELNTTKYCGKSKISYLFSYLYFTLACFFVCTWRCLKGHIDVVHVHNMPNFLVFTALLPRLLGKKLILDIHDTVPETYMAKFGDAGQSPSVAFWLFCLEEKICCCLAHKIICVNHTQKDVLVQRGIPGNKIEISLNVPDHRRFGMNSERRNQDPMEPTPGFKLVYHGTLARRLGLDLAIKAVADLTGRIPDIEFHIIGGGDDQVEFARYSKEMKLEGHVFFEGFCPVESLVSVLSGMDVGVIPNRKSIASDLMLPVKMLEYVALNIPVVAPRLKTIERYFTEEMARYYEPGNVDDLARAIYDLKSDESLRNNQIREARKFLERYGWERHHQDLLNLYQAV